MCALRDVPAFDELTDGAEPLSLRAAGQITSLLTFDAALADGARQHGLELLAV